MKIAYDHKIFSNQKIGGPSRYFVELIKALIKKKEDATVYSPIYINNHLNSLNKEFVKGIFLNNKNHFGKLINIYNNISSKIFFSKFNHDILHTTYYDDKIFSKKPIVITVYDLIHEIFSNEFNYEKLPKKEIFKRVDHFICISKNTQQDLIKYYGIDEKKTSVTYLSSFGLQNFSAEKYDNKPFFLYVGSRKRYKNFSLLIEAFSKNKKISQNYEIICFGGGKLIKDEYDLLKKFDLEFNQIKQLDGDDELLVKLYKNAEAYICTSKYEGFGLPILEAMRYSCPVISSNTSSLPEVCGNAALTFRPSSSDELINCIEKIISDTVLKKEIILKGIEQSQKFSWEKCADETLKIYNNLV